MRNFFLSCLLLIISAHFLSAEPQQIIDYSTSDIRLYISNSNVLNVDMKDSPVSFDLDIYPNIYMSHSFINASSEGDIYTNLYGSVALNNNGIQDLEIDNYSNITYRNYVISKNQLNAGFGVNLNERGFIDISNDGKYTVDYFSGTVDLLFGRLVSQTYIAKIEHMIRYLKIMRSEFEVLQAAQILADYESSAKKNSEEERKRFVTNLSSALKLSGNEYEVYRAYENIRINYRLNVGTRIDTGFSVYVNPEYNSYPIYAHATLFLAGKLGNKIWYEVAPELRGYVGSVNDELDINLVNDIDPNKINLHLMAQLQWLVLPKISLEMFAQGYKYNFLLDKDFSVEGFNYIYSYLSTNIQLADNVDFSMSVSMDIKQKELTVDYLRVSWKLL